MTMQTDTVAVEQCICPKGCPVTEDGHWINCPAHEYYQNYARLAALQHPGEIGAKNAQNGGLDGATDDDMIAVPRSLLAAAAKCARRHASAESETYKRLSEAAMSSAPEGRALPIAAGEVPIDMVLYCPNCGEQHVDAATEAWANPPHRSHLCHDCGCIWRPADVATNGVAEIKTEGTADTWAAYAGEVSAQKAIPLRSTAEAGEEAIARIIDPDAWHNTLPVDGCGAYWMGRRNAAKTKAASIAALSTPPADLAECREVLEDTLDIMGRALDKADALIERAYGLDVPADWHATFKGVAIARASPSRLGAK